VYCILYCTTRTIRARLGSHDTDNDNDSIRFIRWKLEVGSIVIYVVGSVIPFLELPNRS